MTHPSELDFLQTQPSKAGRLLQPYELTPEEAIIETFNSDGSQLTVIFRGPNAEEYAKEFIDFQNQRNEE